MLKGIINQVIPGLLIIQEPGINAVDIFTIVAVAKMQVSRNQNTQQKHFLSGFVNQMTEYLS
ncbi:hypothetical protein [Neomoorella thermoacetica]|uniref:hypothetical protein n=1 Tax=Neomoorella thermoacetica TaxID=1525 RepID=UPI0021CC6EC3|nr:hypothetical protein [Moorella thermoacetica]